MITFKVASFHKNSLELVILHGQTFSLFGKTIFLQSQLLDMNLSGFLDKLIK